MADNGQANIRVAEKAKPIVHRLARFFRKDPKFRDDLSRLAEEISAERASFIAASLAFSTVSVNL